MTRALLDPGLLAGAATVLACLLFLERRTLRYLQAFQQEEYATRRFLAWVRRTRAWDRRGTLVAAAACVATLLAASPPATRALGDGLAAPIAGLASLALVAVTSRERDPRGSGKVRLRMTARARRIHRAALLFAVVGVIAVVTTRALVGAPPASTWIALAVVLQSPPLLLVAAERALAPGERRRQAGFLGEALARLSAVSPYVVGITGSYGKTSTKGILAAMMDCLGPTFRPPGSVNTLMGITRCLREDLADDHRYALFELAAYREGSIANLCGHLRPRAGLITNIGVMHLERFGSPEAVYRAKSELARALPDGGLLVLNADDPGCRRVAREHPHLRLVRYGVECDPAQVDFHARAVAVDSEGQRFVIRWEGREYAGTTALLGRPMLSNALGAFALAASLGANPDYLLAVLANQRPVKNRLQLERDGDVVFLHDAHNSNPEGFRSALDVLALLPAAKRILVTPGMVELGEQQAAANRAAGAQAADVCDRVFVVGETNRDALLAGLADRNGERGPDVRVFADRDSALGCLRETVAPGDVVLIENDLPDLYEARPGF